MINAIIFYGWLVLFITFCTFVGMALVLAYIIAVIVCNMIDILALLKLPYRNKDRKLCG